MSDSRTSRNSGLDYLRALSVVIVLANHCFLGLFVATGVVTWDGLASYLSASAIISIEWLFVLSGYLIGTMMIRIFEKEHDSFSACRDFWVRRWFRTLPCYYLFLLVNIALSNTLSGTGTFDWTYVVFSQNLLHAERQPHFFGESWSLAVDEWFYLIMPVLLIVSSRLLKLSTRDAFFFAALSLICLPFLARLIHVVPGSFFQWDADIRRITIYHLDATGRGVLVAALSRWAAPWWQRSPGLKACVGALLTFLGLATVWKLVHSGWPPSELYALVNASSISLMGAGTLLLLPAIVCLRPVAGWVHGTVARISLYSYTLYLSHFPLLFIIRAAFDLQADSTWPVLILAAVIWLALVWVVSVLVFRFFEKPVSDLRERLTTRVDAKPFGT